MNERTELGSYKSKEIVNVEESLDFVFTTLGLGHPIEWTLNALHNEPGFSDSKLETVISSLELKKLNWEINTTPTLSDPQLDLEELAMMPGEILLPYILKAENDGSTIQVVGFANQCSGNYDEIVNRFVLKINRSGEPQTVIGIRNRQIKNRMPTNIVAILASDKGSQHTIYHDNSNEQTADNTKFVDTIVGNPDQWLRLREADFYASGSMRPETIIADNRKDWKQQFELELRHNGFTKSFIDNIKAHPYYQFSPVHTALSLLDKLNMLCEGNKSVREISSCTPTENASLFSDLDIRPGTPDFELAIKDGSFMKDLGVSATTFASSNIDDAELLESLNEKLSIIPNLDFDIKHIYSELLTKEERIQRPIFESLLKNYQSIIATVTFPASFAKSDAWLEEIASSQYLKITPIHALNLLLEKINALSRYKKERNGDSRIFHDTTILPDKFKSLSDSYKIDPKNINTLLFVENENLIIQLKTHLRQFIFHNFQEYDIIAVILDKLAVIPQLDLTKVLMESFDSYKSQSGTEITMPLKFRRTLAIAQLAQEQLVKTAK